MSNSSAWSIYRTLLDATSPGEIGSGSIGIEDVFQIPKSSKAEASPSDFVSYQDIH